jgi:uncharacterized protein
MPGNRGGATGRMRGGNSYPRDSISDVLFERGLYWASGRGGLVDLVAAHKWFKLTALKGRKEAIALRREIAQMMSEAEIATAHREARAWIARSACSIGSAQLA